MVVGEIRIMSIYTGPTFDNDILPPAIIYQNEIITIEVKLIELIKRKDITEQTLFGVL